MELNLAEHGSEALSAGYACPCGCAPVVEYARGGAVVSDSCCCGNEFAVGPQAATTLMPKAGFDPQRQVFETHWGDQIEAAWLLGPGVHPTEGGHDHHDHHAEHDHGDQHEHGNHQEHSAAGHDHGDQHEHHADHAAGHDHAAEHRHTVIDPVCGMAVEPDSARERGLHATHAGTDYFFCGKGCLLEFGDDPGRFLDASYVPSM